jgi:hypothetical protein
MDDRGLVTFDAPIDKIWIAPDRKNPRSLLAGKTAGLWELPYQLNGPVHGAGDVTSALRLR